MLCVLKLRRAILAAMDSMNVSTTLSPEQQICLDRLMAEGGIQKVRKKGKLPLPLKMKGELKKDSKDESTTTISERLWEDEWHRDSGQCQQAVEAASSSKGDGQQPHEKLKVCQNSWTKVTCIRKGKHPRVQKLRRRESRACDGSQTQKPKRTWTEESQGCEDQARNS